MEAIKCPNCGSEKVKELTDEKWVCLACDNVFLVHNLSKEFRQTDEHISEVHKDIAQKLSEIKEVSKNDNNNNLNEILFNAEEELSHGDFLKSYTEFKRYSVMAPQSSIGYEGMFRALTGDYNDDAGDYKVINKSATIDTCLDGLHDGFDTLKKALECEDCNKDTVLEKVLKFYRRSAKSLLPRFLYGDLANCDDEFMQSLYDEITSDFRKYLKDSIRNYEEKERAKEAYIAENKIKQEEFEKLSSKEKSKKRGKQLLPLLISIIISVLIWSHEGWFLHIVNIIALLFIAIVNVLFIFGSEPVDSGLRNEGIDEYQRNKDVLSLLDKIDALDKNDMERMICDEWDKGVGVDQLYQNYLDIRKRKEAAAREKEEGYYEVIVNNWGLNPETVRNILRANCADPSSVENPYQNRAAYRLYGLRKSVAYDLQDQLVRNGASAVVNKM